MSFTKGLNRDGFDKDGYDVDGYNRYGYDKDGYNRWGFNRTEYDRGGKQDTHRIYDQNGFDDQCLDIQGEVPVLQFDDCACRTLNELFESTKLSKLLCLATNLWFCKEALYM